MQNLDWIFLSGGTLAYGVGLAFVLVTLRQRTPEGLGRTRIAVLCGIAIHALFLALRAMEHGHFPVTSLFEFTLVFANTFMLLAMGVDVVRRMPIMTIASVPLSLLFLLSAFVLATAPGEPSTKATTLWSVTHVLVSLGAFGCFALSFVAGILYLVEQQQLKGRPRAGLIGMMPSLQTLQRLIQVAISLGILLLTAGGVIGYLYARTTEIQSQAWRTDPKILLTTLTWAAYGLILLASPLPFFRGRRTAWATLFCFALLVFTAWATVFWSPFHNYL